MRFILKRFGNSWLFGTFICLFLLIYFNNETLANNLCTFINQPCMYVAIGIIAFFVCSIHRTRGNISSQSAMPYIFVSLLFLVLNGMMDTTFANGYFLTMMNIVVAFMLSKMIRFRDFSLWYIEIMVILAICSLLITYPLASIVRSLSLPHVMNSANVPFTNAYICYLVDFGDYYRNTGIFREAGVWGGFLLIALMLTIENSFLYSPQKYWFHVILLVATIISTFSTACLVAMVMVFCIMIIKRKSKEVKKISNLWLIVGAVGVVFVTLKMEMGAEALTESVDKLVGNSSSMDYRTEVMKNAVPVIFSNPLGCGILQGTQMLTNANTLNNYHNTSTFVAGTVYFGCIYILLYLVGLYKFCKRRLCSWLYMAPFFMLLNAEQYIFNPIFYLLIFYGFQKSEQENLAPLCNS